MSCSNSTTVTASITASITASTIKLKFLKKRRAAALMRYHVKLFPGVRYTNRMQTIQRICDDDNIKLIDNQLVYISSSGSSSDSGGDNEEEGEQDRNSDGDDDSHVSVSADSDSQARSNKNTDAVAAQIKGEPEQQLLPSQKMAIDDDDDDDDIEFIAPTDVEYNGPAEAVQSNISGGDGQRDNSSKSESLSTSTSTSSPKSRNKGGRPKADPNSNTYLVTSKQRLVSTFLKLCFIYFFC